MSSPTANSTTEFFRFAERRIGWLTLALGFTAALIVAAAHSSAAGAGVATGTVLSWLSGRWLGQSLDGLVRGSVAQHERAELGQQARVPLSTGAKLIGRYALIAAVLYVIVQFFKVPIFSVLGGLFALGAATMVEGIYEAFARKR